jgi:hypothetical protein
MTNLVAMMTAALLGVLPSTTSRIDYTAIGGTTFTFGFKVTDTSHIKVFVDADGAGTASTFVEQTTGITKSLDPVVGGGVVFAVAPTPGATVRIERTVPVTQDSLWTPYSAFKAKTLEGQLDYRGMVDQQLDRATGDLAAKDAALGAKDAALQAEIDAEEATRSAADTAGIANQATKDAGQDAAIAASQAAALSAVSTLDGRSLIASDQSSVLAYGTTRARTLTARAADVTNVLDFTGIDPTGATESSAAVQAALDKAGLAGGGIVFAPRGTYRVKDLIIKYPNVTLRCEPGTVFLDPSDFTTLHNPTIWIARDNGAIEDCTFSYVNWNSANYVSFQTARPAGNSYYGAPISVGYTELYTGASSGVFASFRGVTLQVVRGARIRRVKIVGTAIHGVSILNAIDTKVEDCDLSQFKGTGVFGLNTPHLSVERSRFTSSRDDGVYTGVSTTHVGGVWTPITAAECVDVKVVGNTFTKVGAKAIGVSGYDGVLITENRVDRPRVSAVYLSREQSFPANASKNVVVANNVFENVFGGYGPVADGFGYTTDVTSQTGGGYWAIEAEGDGADHITVTGNRVSISPSNIAYSGLNAWGGDYLTVAGNSFVECPGNAIHLGSVVAGSTTRYVTVSGNTVAIRAGATSGQVIQLNRGLSFATVSGNVLQSSATPDPARGFVSTWEATDLRVTGNTFINPGGLALRRTNGGEARVDWGDNLETFTSFSRSTPIGFTSSAVGTAAQVLRTDSTGTVSTTSNPGLVLYNGATATPGQLVRLGFSANSGARGEETNGIVGAHIAAVFTGDGAANARSADLAFATVDQSVSQDPVERMRITHDGRITMTLPTSSAGLPSGAIWSNAGVLNVVP